MQVDIKKFKSFPDLKKRFLANINKECFLTENENSCWPWIGNKYPQGYGQIWWGNEPYRSNRISYMIFNGSIPYSKVIRHTCNNPSCVNPKHLILGNYQDNSIDMVKAGNQGKQKLNTEAVKVIKWLLKYKYNRNLVKKLSHFYKISTSTIYAIKNSCTWTWIKV